MLPSDKVTEMVWLPFSHLSFLMLQQNIVMVRHFSLIFLRLEESLTQIRPGILWYAT